MTRRFGAPILVVVALLWAGGCTFVTDGGILGGGDFGPEPAEDPDGGGDPGGGDPGDPDPGGDDPGEDDPGGEDPGGDDPGSDDPGGDVPGEDDPGGDDPGGDDPPPGECTPPCGAGQQCQSGVCVDVGEYEVELQRCVDVINEYRENNGRSALARGADLEDCAAAGAESDSQTGSAHAHFSRTGGCGGVADAENEVPGWPLTSGDGSWGYESVQEVVEEGIHMMMREGPWGGHRRNILGSHASVGCGIYVTGSGDVWVVQNFR